MAIFSGANAIIASVISSAIYLVFVALLLRITHQTHILLIFIGSAVVVFAASLAAVGRFVPFWYFSSYFGAAVVAIIFIYGVVFKSLSVKMLAAIESAPLPGLTLDELADAVTLPAYADRAGLLVEKGFATLLDGHYSTTKIGRRTAERARFWRRRLYLESEGLYSLDQSHTPPPKKSDG